MAYNRIQVRAFLSASELDLFESSIGANCKSLATADLRRRVERTRTLRDKSRDLLQRQKLATRARTGTKIGVNGVANERTAKKATALEEALKRFEAEALVRRTSSVKSPAKPRSAPKSPPVGKRTAGKTARSRPAATVLREALDKKQAVHDGDALGPKPPPRDEVSGGVRATSPAARGRAVASRLADSNLSHIQGHTSTQVRRGQAKRDHKG